MIYIQYARFSYQTLYRADITIDSVTLEDPPKTEELERYSIRTGTMEEIIMRLHELLQKYPAAVITMAQEPTRSSGFEKPIKGYELDSKMRDVIRDDMSKALEMFAPIERTIIATPTPVKTELETPKEN